MRPSQDLNIPEEVTDKPPSELQHTKSPSTNKIRILQHTDKNQSAASSNARPRLWYLSGWRVGVSLVALLMAVVLAINVICTVLAAATFGIKAGVGTLYVGNCKRVAALNTWIHVLINILGTAMLAGSNYCMQRLGAPTRREVDRSHTSKKKLDIGILSLRNLTKISRRRLVVWLILFVSSIPLHLLYNSAVYSELRASMYNGWLVDEVYWNTSQHASKIDATEIGYAEFQETFWNGSSNVTYLTSFGDISQPQEFDWLRNHINGLRRLEVDDCIKTYSGTFQTAYSDVILVVSTWNDQSIPEGRDASIKYATDAINYVPSTVSAVDWVCNEKSGCSASRALATKPWKVKNQVVGYCMVLPVTEHCSLKLSSTIMYIVILCNLIKTACMTYTVIVLEEPALVTIGDAISSFLQSPDKSTKTVCTASRHSIEQGQWGKHNVPHPWDSTRHFWFRSTSRPRWVIANLLCAAYAVTCPILAISSLTGLGYSGTVSQRIRSIGFGIANGVTNIKLTNSPSVIPNILLANLAQLLLSFVYLMYNSIYTNELVTAEWIAYGSQHKRLRVTVPKKGQISSWYLGLPYRYGVPLLLTSALLHFLVSRSIFLVNIKFEDYLGRGSEYHGIELWEITQCGFSPLAIVLSASLGIIFIIIGILNGFRRYPSGPPLAATSSVTLSTACHALPDEVPELAFGPVRWGIVESMTVGAVKHLTLSGREVGSPNATDLYM